MTASTSPNGQTPEDDTALLIAALNHAWDWYDARMNRGLQVVNYFLVASAVLATAYVSALNGKQYAVAAVIAFSGAALTGITLMVGYRQRLNAAAGEVALAELQDRIARRLQLQSVRMLRPRLSPVPRYISIWVAFALAFLLSVGAALYALIH